MLNDALGKLILRLTVGGLMLMHGAAKVAHPGSLEFIQGRLVENGLPGFVAYGVYLGEVIAPLMVIVGFYARIGGMLMAITMLFAIGLVHAADITALTKHGGWAIELQAFFLFCAVSVALMGSGRIAVRPD